MQVKDRIIAGVIKAGFDRFIQTHKMKDTPELRALFFAGAAVGIASQDGSEAAVSAVTRLATEALPALWQEGR